MLKTSVTALDSVAYRMPKRSKLTPRENRTLLAWKKGLDELRNALLGIKVHYTLSDTALTDVQVTYLNISKIDGLDENAPAKILFGGILDEGWAVNENIENNIPLVYNDPYRLLTPKNITYNRPHALFGLDQQQIDRQILFFIIHSARNRERSFIHRSEVELTYVPRFEVEVLTPIVRMARGERVLVRLKNHSRDGVTDTVRIDHEYATASGNAFRLSNKEDSQVVTFFPVWNSKLKNDTYEIPVTIQGEEVARFTARKFAADANVDKTIGLLTGISNSPLEGALSRLGGAYNIIDSNENIEQRIDSLDVLIIDRRALSLKPEISRNKNVFDAFVNRGGHLIILAQDAGAWNTQPLWSAFELIPTYSLTVDTEVIADMSHTFLESPNVVVPEDWHKWLFLRGYNNVKIRENREIEVPVKTESGEPLLLTKRIGDGRKTYLDFAITPQLLNVHPGAFRIFANIISN